MNITNTRTRVEFLKHPQKIHVQELIQLDLHINMALHLFSIFVFN